jgi:pyruvate,water dikinase
VTLIGAGDDRLADATLVGHKFARQAVLRAAGFRVPEFVCVPAEVFDRVAAPLLPPAPAPGSGDTEILGWAAAAAEALRNAVLPEDLAAELATAVGAVTGGGTGLVAVRACVAADADGGGGEDGADEPFAGMTDSFLYVPAADVARRVAECWASGFTPATVLYRARRGSVLSAIRVAVGVQRMVLGDRSFVAFSRDPRTAADTRVIAAALGIGEGVVQERADVDHFFVDPFTGAVDPQVVHKERMVTRGDGEVVPAVVPAELADAPALTDAQVAAVSELSRRVEEHFGVPQDIEGTLTPDGTLYLVQARPMVLPSGGAPIRWSNHNITESYPGVSGALTFSQAHYFYLLTFRDVYRRLGVSAKSLRANDHHLNRMVGWLDGRVYYRLDAWLALHGQLPGFPLIRPWWQKSMGLSGDYRPSRPEVLRALPSLPALAWRLARLPWTFRAYLRWWDALAADTEGLNDWGPERLIAFYRRIWGEAGDRWGASLVNTFFLLAAATATGAAVRRWTGPEEQRILGGLLLSEKENRSVQGVRSAIALAETYAAVPDLRARVERAGRPDGEDPDAVWQDIMAGGYGREVAVRSAEHLRRFGDRALHDLKLEDPSPRQRPSMIVTMVQPMVHSGLTVAGTIAREAQSRAEARCHLVQACPNPVRRGIIRGLAAGLRWFVRAREDARYCRSQLYGLTRQIMWRLGDHLVAAGRLDHRSQVLDLTVDEVLAAYDGTLPENDLRAVAERRGEQRRTVSARPDLPVEFSTPSGLPVSAVLPRRAARVPGQGAPVTTLSGLPSSKGVVTGRARVILDSGVEPESCRDQIIVAKETDPGWLFLMMVARGMVVERGTLLSHTAITGRLLNIPTVVSVQDATTLIPDGALIEVDGATGTIRILPESGPEPLETPDPVARPEPEPAA